MGRHAALFVQLIQIIDIHVLQHLHKAHEDLRRTAGVIHRPVVMLQGHINGLGNRIQLESGQVRQQKLRHGDRINIGEFPFNALVRAGLLDKAHVEIRIVGDHNSPFAEPQEIRQDLCDRRRILDHIVADAGQLLDTERNGDLRIDKRREPVCDLAVFHPHSTDLDDPAGQIGKTCRLNIKDDIGLIQALSLAVVGDSLHIIHEVGLHAVDDLERSGNLLQLVLCGIRMLCLIFLPVSRIDILHGMICLREGLHHAVIGDGNGTLAPGPGPFDQTCRIGHAIHVAHLCMAVKFYPLDRAVVVSGRAEIAGLLDPDDAGDHQLMLPVILRHPALHPDEAALFQKAGQLCRLRLQDKDLCPDRIGIICHRKGDKCLFIAQFTHLQGNDLAPDDGFTRGLIQRGDGHGIPVKVSSIENIRIIRESEFIGKASAGTSALPSIPELAAGSGTLTALCSALWYLSGSFCLCLSSGILPGSFCTRFSPAILAGQAMSGPGKNVAGFCCHLQLAPLQVFKILQREIIQLHLYRQAAPLPHDPFHDMGKLLALLHSDGRILDRQPQDIFLRKFDLRCAEKIKQEDISDF